jgi:hypothetical protein
MVKREKDEKSFIVGRALFAYIETENEEVDGEQSPSQWLELQIPENHHEEEVQDCDEDVERHNENPWYEELSLILSQSDEDEDR